MMVRVLHQGDYLVPREQAEQLRQRLADAAALAPPERADAVGELIAEVTRDGSEAPKGLSPDLVLVPPREADEHPAPPQPPDQNVSVEDDGTHYFRDPDSYDERPADVGRPPSRPYGEGMRDIDPTDPWRG